jgi:hypothetical protein
MTQRLSPNRPTSRSDDQPHHTPTETEPFTGAASQRHGLPLSRVSSQNPVTAAAHNHCCCRTHAVTKPASPPMPARPRMRSRLHAPATHLLIAKDTTVAPALPRRAGASRTADLVPAMHEIRSCHRSRRPTVTTRSQPFRSKSAPLSVRLCCVPGMQHSALRLLLEP